MMLAIGGLALPRTQPNALIAAEDTNTNAVAQLFKGSGLDGAVMKAAVDGVLEELAETTNTVNLKAADLTDPACTAAQSVEANAVAGYKEAKKAFYEEKNNFITVCSSSKGQKEVVMIDDAFSAVSNELRTLLKSPAYNLTVEQAKDCVQAGHEAALVSIDLSNDKDELNLAAQAKGDCAAARTLLQDAKRAVKKERLAKKVANIDKACVCHQSGCPSPPPSPSPAPSTPPPPPPFFKHGDVVLIQNIYQASPYPEYTYPTGTYLDSCGWAGCDYSKYSVFTHSSVRATTTTWKILRVAGEGTVMNGDDVHLQNLYQGDGGYLDSCGGAQCASQTMYAMQTSTSPDRRGVGTGTWKVVKNMAQPFANSNYKGGEVGPLDVFFLQNKYSSYGSYLDSCGGASCSDRYSVSTMSVPERGSPTAIYTGSWKFVKYDAELHKFSEAAEETEARMKKAANLVQRASCGADDPHCMKVLLQNVTA